MLGQTQHGVYDEAENIDPALLHRYYGASRSHEDENPNSHSDSDSSSGSDSSDIGSINSTSSSDSDANSTSGSDGSSSSSSDINSDTDLDDGSNSDEDPSGDEDFEVEVDLEERYQDIAKIIANAQKRNIRHDAAEVAKSGSPFENADELHAYTLALGNALASSEFPAGFALNEAYGSVESYKTGRSSKPLVIPLPYDVWFPRIVVWCKALDLLKCLPMCRAAAVFSE